jgi:hypothetical protein
VYILVEARGEQLMVADNIKTWPTVTDMFESLLNMSDKAFDQVCALYERGLLQEKSKEAFEALMALSED